MRTFHRLRPVGINAVVAAAIAVSLLGGLLAISEPASAAVPDDRSAASTVTSDGGLVCSVENPSFCWVDDSHLADDPRSAVSESTLTLQASDRVTCVGDGTSGPRIQLMHIVPSDNKVSTPTDQLRRVAAEVERIFVNSAMKHSGKKLRPRFVHDASCRPTVIRLEVPSKVIKDGLDGLGKYVTSKGFDSPDRKYMMFVSSAPKHGKSHDICGLGSAMYDNDPSFANYHNWNAGYEWIGPQCWNGHTAAHELSHNLGAVQDTAPNATGFFHCTDQYDVMCYDDGNIPKGKKMAVVCPGREWADLLDCGGDDYFNPSPKPGSYLSNHWNIANSRFLNGLGFDREDPGLFVNLSAPTRISASGSDVPVFLKAQVMDHLTGPIEDWNEDVSNITWRWEGLPEGAKVLGPYDENPFAPKGTRQSITWCPGPAGQCVAVRLPAGTHTVKVSATYKGKTYSASTTITVEKSSFVDTRGHVFSSEIARFASAGITRGCNPPANDRFCPDEPVTRGQMAAFLVRALGLPSGKASFADMKGHVFAGDVAAFASAGITRGCNPPANDRFCPDEPVTRGQMAAFLVRAGLAD